MFLSRLAKIDPISCRFSRVYCDVRIRRSVQQCYQRSGGPQGLHHRLLEAEAVIWAGEEALELLRAILVHLLVPEILIALLRVKLDHQRLAYPRRSNREHRLSRDPSFSI